MRHSLFAKLGGCVRSGSVVTCLWMAAAGVASAQQALPSGEWRLDPLASSLTFESTKKGTIVETSRFASLQGAIEENGEAAVRVVLESVDTGVDLRNVRMRFLFFETYQYPIATIEAQVDRADFAELPAKGELTRDLTYTLSLHGVEKSFTSPVIVRMADAQTVSVASAEPVVVSVADFNLSEGLKKLSEAVGDIDITPSTKVSFDMIFRAKEAAPVAVASADPVSVAAASGALESAGDLSAEECRNRFEVLSRTQAIYFRSGSARLDDEQSKPLLATLTDIVGRCPDLGVEIAGHTDSDGSADFNMRLSERRAETVRDYLVGQGVPRDRMSTVGHGEDDPVAANDTPRNKSRNRRIEFHAREG
ncbi:MAG: OmpA family protein [Rhizobiaceae bacterium]|nr:OmpA family protein [Rhizobiaceae bacterium]MCV0407700.1 OmpA family protein [Rhizobiaceae bacterium]